MPTIGKIKVDLEGDTRRFQRSMRGAKRSITGLGDQLTRLRRSLLFLGGALGFGQLIRRTTEEAVRSKQLSDRVGTNVESFSKLARVLGRAGVGLDQTGVILQRLQRRAAEAAAGNEDLAAVFEELGIDVDEFIKLDPVEAFLRFGEALATVDDNSRKLLLGFKVLDTEGVQVLQTDLAKLRGEMGETTGITDSQAEAITKAAEAWDKMKESISSTLLELGQSLGIFEGVSAAINAVREFGRTSPLDDIAEQFQKGNFRELFSRTILGNLLGVEPEEEGPQIRRVGPRHFEGGNLDFFGPGGLAGTPQGPEIDPGRLERLRRRAGLPEPEVAQPLIRRTGERQFVGGNLDRSNQLLEQIRNNTAKPQPAVAQ